jgi:hypothetical protein
MEPVNRITFGHVAGAPFQVGQRVLVLGVTADEPEEIELQEHGLGGLLPAKGEAHA